MPFIRPTRSSVTRQGSHFVGSTPLSMLPKSVRTKITKLSKVVRDNGGANQWEQVTYRCSIRNSYPHMTSRNRRKREEIRKQKKQKQKIPWLGEPLLSFEPPWSTLRSLRRADVGTSTPFTTPAALDIGASYAGRHPDGETSSWRVLDYSLERAIVKG